MRRLPPLSALRAFEAAARNGSFKSAANELAVTPTAISHQIRSLEDYTGLTLFERKVRKVVLTEAGVQLYPVLRDGFDGFEAMLERLVRAKKKERVTISATNAFTVKWLVPRVASFRRLHPGIDLHLHASDDAVDLAAGEIDIAIRYGQGPYPGLLAEAMFADQFAPLAHPGLGVRFPADLTRLPLVQFQWRRPHLRNPTWENWFAQAGLPWTSSLGQLSFSDEGHAIQAARNRALEFGAGGRRTCRRSPRAALRSNRRWPYVPSGNECSSVFEPGRKRCGGMAPVRGAADAAGANGWRSYRPLMGFSPKSMRD